MLFGPEISFADEWLTGRAKQSGLAYSKKKKEPNQTISDSITLAILEGLPLCE